MPKISKKDLMQIRNDLTSLRSSDGTSGPASAFLKSILERLPLVPVEATNV